MRILTLCILLTLVGKNPIAALAADEKLRATAKELEALWSEAACESVIVKKKGFPLVSIACLGNYDKSQRERFLDVLFKQRFILEKETYRLKPQNGIYLYRTKHDKRIVYFKLYVRDAHDLWPKNPVLGKQLAVHVHNLRSQADLLRWRTLGIPLTFAVTYGRSDTMELLAKLEEYKEEKWLAIPLEDDQIEIADGALLTIADALDSEKLSEYLKSTEEIDGLDGISPLYCSRFCSHVPALRALLSALRERNGERALTLVDTDVNKNSSFYETGRIMGFRTFRAFVTQPTKGEFCQALQSFLDLPEQSASRIMAVDAADEAALRCLKQTISAAKAPQFVRVSAMSLTNPFR